MSHIRPVRSVGAKLDQLIAIRLNRRRLGMISDGLWPGARVLDLGAGDCIVSLLAAHAIGCKVVPVDVIDYNKTDLPLMIYDGIRVPFLDKTFDVTLLLSVLHHCNQPDDVLREAVRVNSGRILVVEDVVETWFQGLTTRCCDTAITDHEPSGEMSSTALVFDLSKSGTSLDQ